VKRLSLHSWTWLLGLVLLTWGMAMAAQDPGKDDPEPPVRLKKKVKTQTPPPETAPKKIEPEKKNAPPKKIDAAKKALESKDEAETEARELEQKMKETLERLAKNLREAESRLDKKDAGDGTQQVQRDIVKDLEDLMEQSRRQQQQDQQQGGQKSKSKSRSQKQRGKQNAGNPKQKQSSAKGMRDGQQNQDQEGNNARGGNATKGRAEVSKIADLYKDIWGHLPETLRQEMNQYSREQFMAKYDDLLRQYYARIAEKGRRKGDQ
jgi:hypothetical protein